MENKVVVITGASSGIGAAVAERLAKDKVRLVLVARRENVLQDVAKRCACETLVAPADVTQRAAVENVAKLALERFGEIDVWINNAGRGITKNATELTDADLDDMILTNVKSALYGMQAVLPHFKARGKGQIINVSSLLGRLPLFAPRSAYNVAKHALNGLTGSWRVELRGTGIMVTTVNPGVVATDFGINALHGGLDSKQTPGAQPVEEVAEVVRDVIANPRADVYTRPQYRQMIASYYAAEDMATAEAAFGAPPR